MKKAHLKKSTIFKIIILSVLVITIASIGLWFGLNYKKIKASINGSMLYTQQEVSDAYLEGVGDSKAYEQRIEELLTQYDKLQNSYNKLSEKNSETVSKNEALTSELESAKNTIQSQERNLNTQTTQISELNQKIQTLQEKVSTLNETIVYFTFKGEEISEIKIQKNTTLTKDQIPTFNVEGYNFLGWTINGERVDLSTYQITEITEVKANVQISHFEMLMGNYYEYREDDSDSSNSYYAHNETFTYNLTIEDLNNKYVVLDVGYNDGSASKQCVSGTTTYLEVNRKAFAKINISVSGDDVTIEINIINGELSNMLVFYAIRT